MRTPIRALTSLVVPVVGIGIGTAAAQSLPTSQPKLLQIIREEVKLGHAEDHARTEEGWPAAFERAKSPDYYVAMASMTGSNEVWFVIPLASHAAMGEMMKREQSHPMLATELPRLTRADAEHLIGTRTIHAAARTDLSIGAYPDTAKQRFWEITIFRVRPGHEPEFDAAAKAYGAAATRAGRNPSFRVYEIVAGLPGPTYLVFSSTVGLGELDRMAGDGEAMMKAATPDERATLQKFMAEGVVNVETQRFRLDPRMSYVPREVRMQDPDFWMPKKPAAKPKPTNP